MERLERSLQFHFAVLTALGGLMMASGEVGWMLPTIAVVAAAVSFLVVDLGKWFHLPTPAAYVGMGLVAIYCMGDFLLLQNENQLTAVAELLVLVEAVLLFQRKSARVFEQIGIFCLLELIVAAVFNHALEFGLLLIPFSLIGIRALVLLHALTIAQAAAASVEGVVRTRACDSGRPAALLALRLPRWVVGVLGPAVVLVAGVFFFALPRVAGAPGASSVGGRATTGFTHSMTLDQVGELLQNDDLVMRLTLRNQRSGKPYRAQTPLYLRGAVLERYQNDAGVGRWKAQRHYPLRSEPPLPKPYHPAEDDEQQRYDRVEVQVDVQPLTSGALFAIAPYHSLNRGPRVFRAPTARQVIHRRGQWLLSRVDSLGIFEPDRFEYRFGTHAFRDGVQTRFVRYLEADDTASPVAAVSGASSARQWLPGIDPRLYSRMLAFTPSTMPTVAAEAQAIADSLGELSRSPYHLAQAIENYLTSSGRFEYTLNLNQPRDRTTDPIEAFLSESRRGHCQYFASAMVMMLRSQDVPARIVLGYKTDEYNPLAKHYVVRQLHAHAWVEIMIPEDQLPDPTYLAGQPPRGPVLVRFDPTPSSSGEEASYSHANHYYDFAQAWWNNYILDMNGEQQHEQIFSHTRDSEMRGVYAEMLTQLKELISRGMDERFREETLAISRRFSWRAALLSVIVGLMGIGVYWMGLPELVPRVWRTRRAAVPASSLSSIDFYQQLCRLLASHELYRGAGQTPLEFASHAAASLTSEVRRGEVRRSEEAASEVGPREADDVEAPLRTLVDWFYRVRYGGTVVSLRDTREVIAPSLEQIAGFVHRSENASPRPKDLSPASGRGAGEPNPATEPSG